MAWLGRDLLPEIAADEHTSRPFSQLTSLSAILLGLCLEQSRPPGQAGQRMVKVAEIALTALHGASQLAAAAPGFADPFAVVQACEQLTALDLGDAWQPGPPTAHPVGPARQPARAPPPATDALRGQPARLDRDGILAVLGLHRLAAIEEALRAAPPAATLTAVLVTSDPGELGPLARLAVTSLRNCLRAAVAPSAWPRLQLIHDEHGALAAAAGVSAISDATESAVRIRNGRIVAQADGYGACHAAATASPDRSPAQASLEPLYDARQDRDDLRARPGDSPVVSCRTRRREPDCPSGLDPGPPHPARSGLEALPAALVVGPGYGGGHRLTSGPVAARR